LIARVRSAAYALAAVLCLPAGLFGQSPETLASTCAAAGGDAATCAAAAVGARAVVAQVGLLAGQGSELPGEGSTLGRRLGGMPRVAAWVRGGVLPLGVPDPADPNGADEASAWTPGLQAGLGLGVFGGFHLMPTVGGFLSLDVFGTASFLFLPDGSGFDGRVGVYTVGARVGVLQESFTLPGVSVSASRRFSGEVQLGDASTGDPMAIRVDPSVTSIRATVSKDLFAFGVLAGLGWDDFSSDVGLNVTDGATGIVPATGSLDGTRRLYFGSLTKQLGILAWITVEGGWADGFDPVAGYTGTGHDPEKRSTFGSVTLLLKL
jgi:hypothetical protein